MKPDPIRLYAFAAALAFTTPGWAVDEHHPDAEPATAPAAQGAAAAESAGPTSAELRTLREQMQEVRRTRDPAWRMQMMDAHLTRMEAAMQKIEAGCPGMMGGRGMMRDGQGMTGCPGMAGRAETVDKRLDAIEKRLEMIQMLLQQSGGRTPGSTDGATAP